MSRRLSLRTPNAPLPIVLALTVGLLSACQSAPPPAADGKAVTVGDWTVRTGGYVRAEAGMAH